MHDDRAMIRGRNARKRALFRRGVSITLSRLSDSTIICLGTLSEIIITDYIVTDTSFHGHDYLYSRSDLTPALSSEASRFYRVTPGFSKTPAPSDNLFSAFYSLGENISTYEHYTRFRV